MTTEEKAKELIEKFQPYCDYDAGHIYKQKENAKACALICVEEILDAFACLKGYSWSGDRDKDPVKKWQQVKEYLTMEENKK